MRLADDDRRLQLVANMAVRHARHRAIARHVDQRAWGCGVQRHDLVIADDAVIDALRVERGDMGGAGTAPRLGPRFAALRDRIPPAHCGLAPRPAYPPLARPLPPLVPQ